MTRWLTRSAAALAALLSVAGVAAAQSAGSADFSRYVALGDSLTHAFSSGGVVNSVQVVSYPALIARQAGALDFQQPLISEPGIPPLLALQSLSPGPVIVPRSATPGAPTNLNLPRPYNNLGVSGFRVHDVLATVTANPLVDTVLRGIASPLQQAAALQPTLVTLWIGNNDVLAAATSGRVIEGVTLTPVPQFRDDYAAILDTLRALGADVVAATIPAVTALPFVTTIPPVVVNPATREPVLVNGQPVPLLGPDGPLAPGDRVLLTASPLLAQGIGIPRPIGSGLPLPDDVVLDAEEVAEIAARQGAYNIVIRAESRNRGVAVVPIDEIFDDIVANGFGVGGNIVYTTDFLTGGLFSYDGVHPTPFGYAVVANAFLETINEAFGASIPAVDLFPFVFGAPGSGGATEPVTGGVAAVVFTPAAYESLRFGLRVPPKEALDRIEQRRREREGGPGGGGGEPVAGGGPLVQDGGLPPRHGGHPGHGDLP
jgi:lysophospholipase L1-like esterase